MRRSTRAGARARLVAGLGAGLLVLAGCGMIPLGPLGPDASPPEDSGLIGEGPYPTERSPCRVIGSNDRSSSFMDRQALLIGCPSGDQRAINRRVDEGAQVVALEGQWLLLRVPRDAVNLVAVQGNQLTVIDGPGAQIPSADIAADPQG